MYQNYDWPEITANNIRDVLNEKSLTQSQLANLLNVNPRTVRRWVSGGIDNINVLCRICLVLDIKMERLFCKE